MNSMTRIITRLLVVSLLAFVAACSDTSEKVIYDGAIPTAPVADTPSSDPEIEPGNIIDVATEAGGFSEFLAAAESAGLLDALTDETASLTIFAPTDDAFTALGKIASPSVGAKVALSELSSDELANILLYHVLSGEVSVLGAGELAPTTVETLNGADVAITMRDDDYLYVNMAKVVSYDIEASNGVIHVIEEVLLPPDTSMSDMSIADIVEASDDFDTLETAVVTANMLADLADDEATFTVFAPTDAAFDELGDAALSYALGNLDLLSNTLGYHLVADAELYSSDAIVAAAAGSKIAMANGDESTFALDYAGVMINDANIVTTDIVASNGVIHVIDMVMDAPSSEPPPIAITLAAEGSFTTLVDLVAEAGLTDALMDPSANLTVFAPTDDAFALIPGDDLAALRADTDALTSALQYHLYPDTIAAADLALLAGTPLSMATGDTADISTTSDGGVKINDANVVAADIAANNGIVHAINRVIFPSEDGEEEASPLVGRWKIASVPGASWGVGPAEFANDYFNDATPGVRDGRACFFDDEYVFGADGSFMNVQQDETWVESWQAGVDACGTPVAPHDGSNPATFAYDEANNSLTLTGVGAYIGLPKAINGAEIDDPALAPESITYNAYLNDDGTLNVTINVGGNWWNFILERSAPSPLEGAWKIASVPGASWGVGPAEFANDYFNDATPGVRDGRACFFDDEYVFGADGSFMNVQQDETWVESWQAGVDACGTPVAPHDGSNPATFAYDEANNSLTLTGVGAYIGLPKAINGAEIDDPALAPESITYNAYLNDDGTLNVTINVGGNWWNFILERKIESAPSPLEGAWKIASVPGASWGVGPAEFANDYFNDATPGVRDGRACFFDDEYVFGADGSFMNVQQDETWVESWQAGVDACGTPVAPHDGSNPATFAYDEANNSLTLTGVGAYIGLPKAINGAEIDDPAFAPESITYNAYLNDDGTLNVTINVGGNWWNFILERKIESAPSPLQGAWKIASVPGASWGVGPAEFANDYFNDATPGVRDGRACFFDDEYVFGADGSFMNVQQDETWVESWQAGVDACGTPVAPHDGSNPATFAYDEANNSLTLTGVGAYIGLPKAINGAEIDDPALAPESITYNAYLNDDGTLNVTINVGGNWWNFILEKAAD